jgi:glycosyltransferase 2 family protein
MSSKSRRYLLLLVGILGLGYFFYKFRNSITLEGFRWSVVGESLRHANIPLLLLAILTTYACFAIRAVRWMRFSRAIGQTRFWNVYRATLMGFACTFLLGRAGEPVRPVLIARKDSLPIPHMFGVYVLERVFDMAAAIVLAGSALLLFKQGGLAAEHDTQIMRVARSAGVVLLMGLVVVVGFLIYFRFHGAGWLARKLQHEKWRTGWREKVAVLLEGFSDGLQGIRTWADLVVLLTQTAVHWVMVIVAYLFVFHALRGELWSIGFSAATLVLAFTLVGSAAQLPGVGGGAQVASFLVLTLIMGVNKEPAATGAIMVWLVTFASCSLVGLPLLFHEGWSMGELRQMAKAEEKAGEAALLEEAEKLSTRTVEPLSDRGEKPR